MNISKKALLGGAAFAAVLAATTSAQAFNKVEWKWDLDFYENIYKDIYIDVTFDPAGVALLQFGQVQVGDVEATATMDNVHNDPYTEYELVTGLTFDGSGTTNGSLDVEGEAEGFVDIDFGHWTSNCGVDGDSVCQGPGSEDDRVGLIGIAGNPAGESITENGVPGSFGSEDPLSVSGSTSGQLGVTVSGTVDALVAVEFDSATELPLFENLATAVGNNASITSDRMIEFHGGQFIFDTCGNCGENGSSIPVATLNGNNRTDPNPYWTAGTAITIAAILGVVDKADITATANMNNVSQGQMENAATAVGNNFSATLSSDDPEDPADGVLMGDLTQVAVADVTASASLTNATVSNYSGLGLIDGALFSNVATAVGNNLSITVDAGVGDVIDNGGNGGE